MKPKSDLNRSFGLNHFAGVVFYDCRSIDEVSLTVGCVKTFLSLEGFLEKNRDTFSTDMLGLIATSKFSFLVHLFANDLQGVQKTILKIL